MNVSVAFVIRRGGALWRISELLSQLIYSMRLGMFFFYCNSAYVVLTRSLLKWYELNNKMYCYCARANIADNKSLFN